MSDFVMPSLGADMDEGTLVEWMVKPGDQVHHGDIIAVIETAKGAIDVEVFEDGEVETLYVMPVTTVPVGTPLAHIRSAGDAATAAEEPVSAPSLPEQPANPVSPAPTQPVVAPISHEGRKIAPAARVRARELGVDLSTLSGSGPEGAITHEDVERAAAQTGMTTAAHHEPKRGFDTAQMRAAIAAAMARSKKEIPHYYLATTADITSLQSHVDALNADRPPEERLMLSAFLLKAVAQALAKTPELNGFYQDGAFQASESRHLGMAINLRGGGLIAPAIHDVDRLSVDDIMTALRDLVTRARQGGLRSSELTDPTITVTALGERGVDTVFGIIYPPQVALVGFGKPVIRPWICDNEVMPRLTLHITLAADHRVSDGHRGALFLAELERLLSDPEDL